MKIPSVGEAYSAIPGENVRQKALSLVAAAYGGLIVYAVLHHNDAKPDWYFAPPEEQADPDDPTLEQ